MYYFMFQKSSFCFKKGRSYNLGLTQPWKNKSMDIKYSETGKIWLSLHHSERESLGSRNFHCTVRASDVGGNIPALRNLSANAFVLWAIHLPYFDIKKKRRKNFIINLSRPEALGNVTKAIRQVSVRGSGFPSLTLRC